MVAEINELFSCFVTLGLQEKGEGEVQLKGRVKENRTRNFGLVKKGKLKETRHIVETVRYSSVNLVGQDSTKSA